MTPPAPRIVLASASPRRRELLDRMGLRFDVEPSTVDEAAIPADHPRTFALRAAWAKARDVAGRLEPGAVVLAADTVVTYALRLFGKPPDAAAARRMLRALSGQTHQVITAVALARAGSADTLVDSETTAVAFRELGGAEIEAYIASGCPFDKAGAYGIQAGGGEFVAGIEGDYYNVVGLPCRLTARLLAEFAGIEGLSVPPQPERWR